MRENFRRPKKINLSTPHDIKLALDVRCQKRIETLLNKAFPGIAVLGEEGRLGNPEAARRWVVDPIDGTVNFTYGIPHACVSIALQLPGLESGGYRPRLALQTSGFPDAYETILGVVYDPFQDELWTALRGQSAQLNGKRIHVSRRRQMREAVVSFGFGKDRATMEKVLPAFNQCVRRVRKVRIMGAAALAMVYVASGRLDAYVEYGLRLWDIAAGGLIVECAGGDFWRWPVAGEHAYQIVASNGLLRHRLLAVG